MSARLIIERIGRTAIDGSVEALQFTDGVNAIVGPQNTGKSTWLRMLDFLMADSDSASAKFDQVLVRKYCAVWSLMRFGSELIELERQWTEDGSRSQMRLNGERVSAEEVQRFFLDRLAIPSLRFPQGNVWASDRTWPTLGWRSLLRHIYRRQDYWSDLVPSQPESEQHACILQFLGLAEHLFSTDLSELTDKRRQLAQLQTRQEYFNELMQQLLPDLMGDPELLNGITAGAIERVSSRIGAEIQELITKRSSILAQVRDQSHSSQGQLAALLRERAQALRDREEEAGTMSALKARLVELRDYQSGLRQELARLDRAEAAAGILEDIKVTHCPACDQSISDRNRFADHCFLCGQITLDGSGNDELAARRLKFERDQIIAELAEAEDLLVTTQQDCTRKELASLEADRRVRDLERRLRPFQAEASGLLPEEVALVDQQIGGLNAKRDAVEALVGPLEASTELASQISSLQADIKGLEANVSKREEVVDFEKAGERLSEGFNTYLNTIREQDESSWTKVGQVSTWISERRTQLQIGGRPAKPQLGGTLTIYFLFAYHYALLNLTKYSDCHYPGLAILDFYPDIAQERALGDRLHLVLGPFVQMSLDPALAPIQVIATSRGLPERPNINFIHLTETWR